MNIKLRTVVAASALAFFLSACGSFDHKREDMAADDTLGSEDEAMPMDDGGTDDGVDIFASEPDSDSAGDALPDNSDSLVIFAPDTANTVEEDSADRASSVFGGQGAGRPEDNALYFSFDSSRVDADALALLKQHADYLMANPHQVATLNGHADERGSREYNLALGERRARAVSQYLMLQGVSRSQLRINSYGEEQPVAFGHNEAAWNLNRRVEIDY